MNYPHVKNGELPKPIQTWDEFKAERDAKLNIKTEKLKKLDLSIHNASESVHRAKVRLDKLKLKYESGCDDMTTAQFDKVMGSWQDKVAKLERLIARRDKLSPKGECSRSEFCICGDCQADRLQKQSEEKLDSYLRSLE